MNINKIVAGFFLLGLLAMVKADVVKAASYFTSESTGVMIIAESEGPSQIKKIVWSTGPATNFFVLIDTDAAGAQTYSGVASAGFKALATYPVSKWIVAPQVFTSTSTPQLTGNIDFGDEGPIIGGDDSGLFLFQSAVGGRVSVYTGPPKRENQ
jgi:hypothetical protein